MKNREKKSKQGTHAGITGAELRPHVPGQDSPSPKARSKHVPPSFSRLYHETHPLLLQANVVERGVAICSKYHFRYVVLITYLEVAAQQHYICVLWSFFCTHVQARALGLTYTCSSQKTFNPFPSFGFILHSP